MWLGIGYTIPQTRLKSNGSVPPPPSPSSFMALESSLEDILLLENDGNVLLHEPRS
jgi:hypothetical protein